MRRYAAVLATLPLLLLAACGGGDPGAQPPPASSAATTDVTTDATPATTAPETSTTPTATTSPATPAPPSSNVDDCFDGDCTLLLTGPVEVPLDAATFYYSSMHVTEISPDTLSYYVPYPDGGGTQSTIGAGLGSGEFGFQGQPSIRVGLVVVDGTPALVLQPGAAA